MRLLFVICDRSITDKVIKLLNSMHIYYHISSYAKGTADSKILSYFGLAETDKELILTFVNKENVNEIMEKLGAVDLIKNQGAVAFTVPMDGIGKKTLEFIKDLEGKND